MQRMSVLRYHEEEQEKERIGKADQEDSNLDDLVHKRRFILICIEAKRTPI